MTAAQAPWLLRPHLLARTATAGRYELPPHIRYLGEYLAKKVVEGRARCVIHCPPRHGKSELAAHWLPVWYLLLWPRRRVVCAAYNETLSEHHSRMARDTYAELAPQLTGGHVSPDVHSAANWQTDAGGGYKAVGIQTSFTGFGANLLVVDDPVKDAQEATSQHIRDKHWQWWLGVASKRLEPNASVILIMHRWNRDDLAGRLIEHEGFEYLRLPALADSDDDPLGRKVGEALWPERFPEKHWEPIRSRGAWDWSALCQGVPTSEEGEIFLRQWLEAARYEGEAPGQVYQSWDLKTKETASGSYAVGLVAKWDGSKVRVVDRVKGRFGTRDSIRHILEMRQKWGAGPVIIEEKAAGPAVIELLRGMVPGIVPVRPDTSKEVRAQAVQPFVADGLLGVPRHADWAPDYIDELADFPLGSNDDQVDATTQLLSHLLLRRREVGAIDFGSLVSRNRMSIR